jgi:alpha-glucuronidase
VAAPDGWSTRDVTETVAPGELAELDVSVTPAQGPAIATLQVEVSAEGDEIGSRAVEVVAVPPGDAVTLALDAGNTTSPVLETYRRFTPQDLWDATRGYGWVGSSPQSRDRGGQLDPLRRDFVNDIPARTLRIAVPPGTHDAYVLVGDSVTSGPTYVRSGGELLGDSEALAAGEFTWLHFTLDGGSTGREVDLELASDPNEHWHLNALVMR